MAEKKIYISGWSGILFTARYELLIFDTSDVEPTGKCAYPYSKALFNLGDSLKDYSFKSTDIDSIINLIDNTLSFNNNRKRVLREALKYFKQGEVRYGHITELQSIFTGIYLSEKSVQSNKSMKKIYLKDATEIALRIWKNRNYTTFPESSIRFWSSLDSMEKYIYLDGWVDGSLFMSSFVLNAGSHFGLEHPDCIEEIGKGIVDRTQLLMKLQPDISRIFKMKDSLVQDIDSLVEKASENEKYISVSVSEGIKNWNNE